MSSIETSDLHQDAALWTPSTVDRYGERRVNPPVPLLQSTMTGVRWLNKRRDVLDSQGNKVSTDAVVIAAREIVVNSLMWLGSLDDLADDGYGTGTGTSDGPRSDLYEVISSDVTPDLKNRFTRWEMGLKRYKNRLPPVG